MKKLVRSPETFTINFLIETLKKEKILKKFLIDYKIKLDATTTCKPDFMAVIENVPEGPLYYIGEFKKRKEQSTLNTEEINRQLEKYFRLKVDNLDKKRVPILENSFFAINLYFLKTPVPIIEKVSPRVREEIAILSVEIEKNGKVLIKENRKSKIKINEEINTLLIEASKKYKKQDTVLIPFLPLDLTYIKGKGGSPSNIKIDPKLDVSVFIGYLFSFILERKIKKEPQEFDITEFRKYFFSSVEKLVYFDRKDEKMIERKLTSLLKKIVEICHKNRFTLIENHERFNRKFRIKVRLTHTLSTRMEDLKKLVLSKLREEQLTRKLDEYIK